MLKTVRKTFFILLGIISLAYYLICIAYAHIGVSWLWIWPILTIFCLLRFYMLQHNVRVNKIISCVYYVSVFLFLGIFIIVESRIVSAMNAEPVSGLNYIITLGAAVRGNTPTSPLLQRIITTIDYMNNNPETHLIASGGKGNGENISEAACIADHAVRAGIPQERILLEEQSRNTETNIKNSFALIPENATAGLVTNSFHMYRAIRTAQLQGHTVSPVPAPTLLPLGIHYTVREFFAVCELELKGALLQ